MLTVDALQENAKVLVNREEIGSTLDKLAHELDSALVGKDPIFLCVLVGAIVPLGHLLSRMKTSLEVDYVHATRYQGEIEGKHEIKFMAPPSRSLKDRVVVIFDDILDKGLTLQLIKDYCLEQGAKEVITAVFVDKKTARDPNGVQEADFKGIEIEDKFIYGFGLDYQEFLRNTDEIFVYE